MTPLVSVIIPAYNARAWIRTAVGSVLDQTYPAVEVIVADDGSTDDTLGALAGLQGGVRSLRLANRGPAAARNAGLALARGKYIMFLDADDWIFRDKLRRQVACLAGTPGISWVYCDVTYLDENGQHLYLASEHFKYASRSRLSGVLFPELFPGNFIPIHAPLFRRQCLEVVGLFDEDPRLVGVEDWDLLLRLSVSTRSAYISEVLAACVLRHGSLSADPAARARRRFHLLEKAARMFPAQIRALGWRGRRIVANNHNWFGYRLYHERRWTEALASLRASLRAWPWQGRAWWYLGSARLRLVLGG